MSNIHIYSANSFIEELLLQKDRTFNIKSYNLYKAPQLNFKCIQKTFIILEVEKYSKEVQSIIENYDCICTIILIVKNHSYHQSNHFLGNYQTLKAPITYHTLFQELDIKNDYIKPLSNKLFINKKAKILNKIIPKGIQKIHLTEKEIVLIEYLMDQKSSKTKEDILNKVFGYCNLTRTKTLETHIYRLRKKIGEDINIFTNQRNNYRLLTNK